MKTPRQLLQDELAALAARHRVPPYDLAGPTRVRDVVRARNEAFYLLRKKGMSLPRIGTIFNRNHSTVLYGIGAHVLLNGLDEPTMARAARRTLRHRERTRDAYREKTAAGASS